MSYRRNILLLLILVSTIVIDVENIFNEFGCGSKDLTAIRDFLKTNIDRSIVIRDSTKVYFLNYQEHGSFTIQFTLLVITRYINYGTTRQALDYLIKDTIGDYFEELLERHLPVSVSVQTSDNELYEIPPNQQDSDLSPKNQWLNWS